MSFVDYGYITDTPFIEGQIATAFPNAKSSFVNESGGIVDYGRAVIYNSTSGKLEIPSATGATFRGITYKADIYASIRDGAGNQLFGVPDKEEVDYLRKGEIAVYTETAITDLDAPVYFRHTVNGAGKDVIGRFRNDDDGASGTVDQIPATQARWLETGSAGSVVKIAIDVV